MKIETLKKNLTHFLSLLLCITLLSCSSEEENDGVNSDSYLWFISGEINGEPFVYGQELSNTTQTYDIVRTNTSSSTCAYSEDNGFSYDFSLYPFHNESLPTVGFEFNRMHICRNTNSQNEIFNSLFPKKEYDFAEDNRDEDKNGGKVGVYYLPSANSDAAVYTTYNSDLSNNYFEITKSEGINQSAGSFAVVRQNVEGVFSVTLYNENDPNDKVVITNGRFKLVLIP
ncbi:hypothetical protein ACSIGC_03550 [Tenacibaculum sp. ZS6-P6]|uniref:hypothetical protein n=1 Tax=Tenacibaculum sp. ZS6-P6 TaxID=3447503 RepID=UPI003F98D933